MVDATFVDAPRQRNSRDQNKTIKEGNVPEEWKDKSDKRIVHKKKIALSVDGFLTRRGIAPATTT